MSCDDELLTIDNISLCNVHIEDARQILQNTDDIVKLKLRKSCKGMSRYPYNLQDSVIRRVLSYSSFEL